VIKTSLLFVFLLGIAACTLTSGAAAQAGGNCIFPFSCGQYSIWDASCIPTPPATAFNCYGFDFTNYCWVLNSLCPAPAGPQENACGPCQKGQTSSPISLASGNTYIEENDIRVPGLGGGLTLVRIWNSIWPSTQTALQIGMFGPNWRSNFEESVFVGADHYMKYARGDGGFWSFGYNGQAYVPVSPGNITATLVQGSGYWTLTLQSGEQRIFDGTTTGKLTEIIDRNGNTTQLSYDSLGRLVTVTDPASRHLYFSYAGSGALVTGVTSDVNLSLSYSYDNQGRLIQYTKNDGTTVSFQYDSNSLISLVTDQNGKVLESHTYDSNGRGLTGSRANGVDAVTISYAN
jgi:YD repeat-containing protein